MSMFDFREVLNRYLNQKTLNANFLQYHHAGDCSKPCADCPARNKRIYENENHIKLPARPHCDCYYTNVETKKTGTISSTIPAPDVWLKLYGKLPDYYITKKEAIEKHGWRNGKNTIAGKAPGKMIGGDVYYNDNNILPEKEG